MAVYHLELRQFPHVARVFNLDREALDRRFVAPWLGGELIEHEDRRWSPERTKLTVLEGPEVNADERGLGRGWGMVTRASTDVTETVLAQARRGAQARPELDALKERLQRAATSEPLALALPAIVELAAGAHPGWRASEQLGLAELATWELLHRGGLELLHAGEPVAAAAWQPALLAFASWTAGSAYAVRVVDAGDGG